MLQESTIRIFQVSITLKATQAISLPIYHAPVLYALVAEANGRVCNHDPSFPDGLMIDAPERCRISLKQDDLYCFGLTYLASAYRNPSLRFGLIPMSYPFCVVSWVPGWLPAIALICTPLTSDLFVLGYAGSVDSMNIDRSLFCDIHHFVFNSYPLLIQWTLTTQATAAPSGCGLRQAFDWWNRRLAALSPPALKASRIKPSNVGCDWVLDWHLWQVNSDDHCKILFSMCLQQLQHIHREKELC